MSIGRGGARRAHRRTPSRPPRLLVINPAADLYGSDRMLLEAAAGAAERGWHVEAALGADGPLAAALAEAGIAVHQIVAPVLRKSDLRPAGTVRLLSRTARATASILRLASAARPDVLYINTVTMPWLLVLARTMRLRSVVHVHEAEAGLPQAAQLVLTAPLRLADTVVFNSRTSRAVAAAVPGVGRTLEASPVILNGLFAPASTPPREALDDGPRLLYVGRLSPRKGVDVAVEAVRLLHERGVAARLDIVGAVFPGYEWYEAELREAVSSDGLTGFVTFHGFRPDVTDLREHTDIALVPSRSDESFGNVVVESLFAQRPVVIADQNGLCEAGDGYAGVVRTRAGDAGEIADAVQTIASDWPRRRVWAQADADVARRRHAPATFRGSVVHVLDRLCGGLIDAAAPPPGIAADPAAV